MSLLSDEEVARALVESRWVEQLSTHSEGGITRADLDMARTLDGVADMADCYRCGVA